MRRIAAPLRPGWRALTGSASAAAVALGLLACLCTLLAVVGPRAGAQLRTGAYRQFIAGSPVLEKAITGTLDYNGLSSAVGLRAEQVLLTQQKLLGNLTGLPLAPARTDWISVTTPAMGVTDKAPLVQAPLGPDAELSYRSTLAGNVRVTAGRLPAGQPVVKPAGSATVILQAAVTQPTAHRFGLTVGSLLPLPGNDIVLRVTAIVRPKNPASTFWTVDGAVAAPEFIQLNPNTGYWLGGFFIAPSALPALFTRVNTANTEITWTFPLALGQLTAAQAIALRPALAAAMSSAGYVTGVEHVPISVAMSTDALVLIDDFAAEAGAVDSVLDLLAVSLAVLAAVVVLLGGWLLAEQRRPDFAVLRARGASRQQLAGLVLAVSAVSAVPGALVGAVIAVSLTPSGSEPLSWWLAGLVVLAALAGPVVVTVRTHRGYAAVVRPDAPPARLPAVRRLMIEGGLVLVAAGGLAVLRYQGAGANGDLYASAAPILLAIGVAVVVLRLYPLLVRGVLRLAGRRAGPSAFLGLVRAARVSGSATLPAFAMVLALALLAFAGMVRGAVVRGEVAASWQQAGADVVVIGTRPATTALQREVAAVPGVQRVAAAAIGYGFLGGVTKFNVLLVNPSQYAALLSATPLARPPATFTAKGAGRGPAAPVLASPGLAAQLGHGVVTVLADGEPVTVLVVGQAPVMSAAMGIGGGGGYLVMNQRLVVRTAAGAANALLLTGSSISHAALQAAVTEAGTKPVLLYRSALLAGLAGAPLQHGTYLALGLGAAAAGCCCLLVLLLSLLLSASARRVALARMATMGLSAGQGRVLGLVELLPQLVAVVAGGLVCAAGLVPLTGPALSLGVFTGSGGSVPVRVELVWLVGAGLGLLVLELVVLAGQSLVTDRYAAGSLRMGE
jgi:putative ABC transport system permease protein